MTIKHLMTAATLALLFGTASVYAQDEHPQESRPEAAKQDEAKPPKQEKQDKQDKEVKPPKTQEEGKPQKQDEKQQEQMKPPKTEERAEPSGHNQQSAAGRSGSRIPDDKFRSHFGRQHTFVVNHVTVVQGQPQFQYSGYSFALVDPWPEGWAYTDDCYIDYIDGEYFLFDLLHPGVRIAVMVVM